MKRIGLLILLLAGTMSLRATATDDIWQKANACYSRSQYDSALLLYQKIESADIQSPELYYNLGNTFYKLNRIGLSVLNYERALRINPGFRNANDNLELAQSRIPNRIRATEDIFFVKWWKQLISPHRALLWAVVSLIFFLFMISLLLLQRLNKAPSWHRPQLIFFSFLCLLFTLFLAYRSAEKSKAHDTAVVMLPDVPMLEEKKKSNTPLLVPEGTVLEIISQKNNLVQVRLPDGRKGWLPSGSVQRI